MNSNPDDFIEMVKRILREDAKAEAEQAYKDWCDALASIPEHSQLSLKPGLIAGVELQPSRWINRGLMLIDCPQETSAKVNFYNEQSGKPLEAYLLYPVFQMGAEMFLKGMWLYNDADFRNIRSDSYFPPESREKYDEKLKKFSHDILNVLQSVESIEVYKRDDEISKFLKILSSIFRAYYFPVSVSKKSGKPDWAAERYPKRFYNDSTQKAEAQSCSEYLEHSKIQRLFRETAKRIEFVWRDHDKKF